MTEVYIKLGWIRADKFEELTGITVTAVRDRINNPNFPEWRLDEGLTKLLSDGYYINYEEHQNCLNRKKSVTRRRRAA